MKLIIFFVSIFLLISCTDTDRASISAYGLPGRIRCFSGGTLILDTNSTGRIQSTHQSDGWEFKDSKTNKFYRVSGTCIIEN